MRKFSQSIWQSVFHDSRQWTIPSRWAALNHPVRHRSRFPQGDPPWISSQENTFGSIYPRGIKTIPWWAKKDMQFIATDSCPPCMVPVLWNTPADLPTSFPFCQSPPVASMMVFIWAGIPPYRAETPNMIPSKPSSSFTFSGVNSLTSSGFGGECIFSSTSEGRVSAHLRCYTSTPTDSIPFLMDRESWLMCP